MLPFLLDPTVWVAFLTLTGLELVLGIDNIIFISILVAKLPPHQRERARRIGLFLALFMRIGLLTSLAWLVGMTTPLFSVGTLGVTGRMLILAGGGLFLVWKSIGEIRDLFAGAGDAGTKSSSMALGFVGAIVQITLIDLVFSLDSIITAVGMVDKVPVMIAAVVASVGLMIAFAGAIGRFINRFPTLKMLALAFLVLVGVVLMAEGAGWAIPKGYVYGAMGFALVVELLNIGLRRRMARTIEAIEAANDAAPNHGAAGRVAQANGNRATRA